MTRDTENREAIGIMNRATAASFAGSQGAALEQYGHEKQSRRMSLVEAIANVAVGFLVALLTQIIVFPLFGLNVSLGENFAIGGLFTLASIARSYALRRVFEAIRAHAAGTATAGQVTRRHRPF